MLLSWALVTGCGLNSTISLGAVPGILIPRASLKWAGDKAINELEEYLLRKGSQQKLDNSIQHTEGETDVQHQCKAMLIGGAKWIGDSALRATMSMTVDTAFLRRNEGVWFLDDKKQVLYHFGRIVTVELAANGIRKNWPSLVALAPSGMVKDTLRYAGDSDMFWRLVKETAVIIYCCIGA